MGRYRSRFSAPWPDAFDERAYLRSILEAEPACVTVIARNGSIVDMNAAGLAMIEATSLEEAQSRPLVELVAAPHRPVFVDLHERVMSGESGSIEFELVGLRGSRRWLETRAVPFRDGSGRVTALLGFTRDVTDSRLHETALRESERRYQVLTNVAPVGIFRTDTSGGTTYVNPQWCTLAGISADEAMGHGWLRAVHPDDRRRIEKGWEQAGNERTASAADYRLVRPDGSVVTVLGLGVPEWSHDGAFLGYIGTITDVTARERAETMLQVQRGLLEMIASGVPLEETLTALITFIERELPEIVASILLVDNDGLRVRHGAAPSLPPEYIAAIDKAPIGPRSGSCGTALYRRAPVITEDIRTDPLWDDYRHIALAVGLRACWSTPIVNRDGIALGSFALYFRQARRPVPQHERLIAMATGVAAVAITRHREEAALATSEERFRATFEYAAVGVAHARPDGRFVRVNPTLIAMTGHSAEEILGLTLADMTHPDNRPADVAQYARLLSSELGHYTTETRFLRKDGEPIWVNATLSMVRTPANAPDYAILIVEDVTARRHLEVQLRQSQRLEAVGLLAGGVAHDFNNVLSVILGLSEAVRDELPAGHALRDDLQEIVDAASRGAAITRQLLTFARKDAGRPVTLDVSQSLEGLHPPDVAPGEYVVVSVSDSGSGMDASGRQLADRVTEMHPRIKTVYMSGYPAHVLEERGQASLAAAYIQKPFTRAVLACEVRAALDEDPPVDLPNA